MHNELNCSLCLFVFHTSFHVAQVSADPKILSFGVKFNLKEASQEAELFWSVTTQIPTWLYEEMWFFYLTADELHLEMTREITL